MRSKQ